MTRSARKAGAAAALLLAFACAGGALGQIADGPNFFRRAHHVWSSGVHSGPALAAPIEGVDGDVEERPVRLRLRNDADAENAALAGADRPLLRPANAVLVAEHVVAEPGAAWMQIHFDDYNLGRGSFLILTSLLNGDQQRLDARTLPKWNDASGYFFGDRVRLQLYAAPGDAGVFASVGELLVRDPNNGFVPESLCDGDDDRVPTTDPRVGRIALSATSNTRFCTAWLVSNGAVLTAGHCLDSGSGNGVLNNVGAGAIVEFNVPQSTSSGTPVPADLDDQYPIDIASVDWSSEGVVGGNTLGDDWAVFELDPNANTGLTAHVANGFFRMSSGNPGSGDSIRISGYGDDSTPSNERNRTLQTDVGPYNGEFTTTNGIRHTYRADTANSNSGSPIIWTSQGVAIGIHTNAGCGDSGGANQGTSFEHNALEFEINDLPIPGAVHVDGGHPEAGENGTIFFPYNQFLEGVNATSAGGVLSVVEGFYNETALITKAMRIETPVGSVVIGN